MPELPFINKSFTVGIPSTSIKTLGLNSTKAASGSELIGSEVGVKITDNKFWKRLRFISQSLNDD